MKYPDQAPMHLGLVFQPKLHGNRGKCGVVIHALDQEQEIANDCHRIQSVSP